MTKSIEEGLSSGDSHLPCQEMSCFYADPPGVSLIHFTFSCILVLSLNLNLTLKWSLSFTFFN